MGWKGWLALAMLVVLGAATVTEGQWSGSVGLVVDRESATVPGETTALWVNGDGFLTRWADSTEFPGAGPNGGRISMPMLMTVGFSGAAFTHNFLKSVGQVAHDTAGTADSTMSSGEHIPYDGYVYDVALRTSAGTTAWRNSPAHACTLMIHEAGWDGGLDTTIVMVDSLSAGSTIFNNGMLVFLQTPRKVQAGDVLSFELGAATTIPHPGITYTYVTYDSVP